MDKVNQFLIITGLYEIDQQEATSRQLNAFYEEAAEFFTAMGQNNRLEILDGLADMMFVSETLNKLGIDGKRLADIYRIIRCATDLANMDDVVDEAFNRVCDNNLDKFDTDCNSAHVSLSYWRGEGYPIEQTYIDGYWVVRLMRDYEGLYAGKILKRYGFVGVDLKDLV